MTFYESNKEVHPTGAEVAEFDDAPPMATEGQEKDDPSSDGTTDNLPGSQQEPT